MKKTSTIAAFVFTLLFLTGTYSSQAQNLVPNPGFEVQDTCPAVSQIQLAQPWNSPTIGTPDLFNSSCGTQNSPARTGIGSAGVYTYSTFPNNREYMQAALTSTLSAGQTYCVNFYVYRANFRYATNRIGAYFSVGAVNQSTTSVLSFTPQVDNNPNNMLSSGSWMQIWGSFVASGGESHILIGSFANDANTDTIVANASNSSKVSYYRVDDISVMACAASVNEPGFAENNVIIYPNPASSVLNFHLENDMKIEKVEILSVAGQVVTSNTVNMYAAGNYTQDVSNLNDGIYVISLTTEFGIVNKRMVISR